MSGWDGDEFFLSVELFVLFFWNLCKASTDGGLLRARDARKVLSLRVQVEPTAKDSARARRRFVAMPTFRRRRSADWTPHDAVGDEFDVLKRTMLESGSDDLFSVTT